MKSAKIFIAFTFLLAFAVCASAQVNQYPNEIRGFEFFDDGKLNNLKILFSSKDEVKAIFGEKCADSCDYNEDWRINFIYVDRDWSNKRIEGTYERIYKPKTEFVGKLARIYFKPKKTALLSESLLIPKELDCRFRIAFEEPRYRFRICSDERITYNISDETTADKKLLKGQIISIIYAPLEEEMDNIYSLVRQK